MRILGGFKEVVDGCVCYYASEGHEHLLVIENICHRGLCNKLCFFTKSPLGAPREFRDPRVVTTSRASARHLHLTATPTQW